MHGLGAARRSQASCRPVGGPGIGIDAPEVLGQALDTQGVVLASGFVLECMELINCPELDLLELGEGLRVVDNQQPTPTPPTTTTTTTNNNQQQPTTTTTTTTTRTTTTATATTATTATATATTTTMTTTIYIHDNHRRHHHCDNHNKPSACLYESSIAHLHNFPHRAAPYRLLCIESMSQSATLLQLLDDLYLYDL